MTLTGGHVHRFNATAITLASNGYVRCKCGAWSSVWRARAGKPPFNSSLAKGLDTRLRNEREQETHGIQRRPDEKERDTERAVYSPDTTPAVDEVLAGRRRP